MNEKIEKLRREIQKEETRIQNCKHDFKEAKFDPETIREGYGSVCEKHGSDIWYNYAGYHDVQKMM